MTVVENIAVSDTDHVTRRQASDSPLITTGSGLEVFALQMVKSDPFVTISEICLQYERTGGAESCGWWHVFNIFRRNRILRRKSRFRYAWGRS
ncbi:MAG: hypothetical protein DRP45_00675 [Candidatus Zixiibacteriota bacterium]|nr:MAG: hypothetical protein DRP45_00675 [candidate division Zixibacteria bacterium]